jgi:hypothetical protein
MILTYTYGGINRLFSGRLRLSVIFGYPANGNRSLARIIEVLLYCNLVYSFCLTGIILNNRTLLTKLKLALVKAKIEVKFSYERHGSI